MTDVHETPKTLNFPALWANIDREATKKLIRYISRRDFMKFLGVGAAGAATLSLPTLVAARGQRSQTSRAAQQNVLPNGIASGDVTVTSAVLWAHSTVLGTVTFDYSTAADFAEIDGTLTAEVTDTMLPVKALVEGLTPNTQYYYRVTAADNVLMGSFRTPAEVGVRTGLRFGVSGDWRGELRPYVALKNVLERELAFFVLHGDTIYADIPSLDFPGEQAQNVEDYRVKHNEVYSGLDGQNYWAEIRAAVPIMATIDDHEVTNDFAGGAPASTDERFTEGGDALINTTMLYRNGMQVFQEYNPLRDEFYGGTGDERMDERPKLYRYVTYGSDAAVFVLDARSFRDASVPATEDIFNRAAVTEYLNSMFAPGRTMLGRQQLDDLKRDVMAAHEAGVLWKFIMMPEPVMHMGWFGGNDRWEGYAPERTEFLQWVEENNILNVVFVSADVHTTFVNNLFYQLEAGGALIPTRMWEISTGSVAFYPPTGQALVEGAAEFGLVSEADFAAYQAMSVSEKDDVLLRLFNQFVMALQGYNPIGLDNTDIPAELVQGKYIAGHTFGWTEFDIAPDTGVLTVTTYGVPAYSQAQIAADLQAILALMPEVVSQIRVTPFEE